jgi:hypothetical protein
MVLKIEIYVFWTFVSYLWSDQSEFMVILMVFNLWIDPGESWNF